MYQCSKEFWCLLLNHSKIQNIIILCMVVDVENQGGATLPALIHGQLSSSTVHFCWLILEVFEPEDV